MEVGIDQFASYPPLLVPLFHLETMLEVLLALAPMHGHLCIYGPTANEHQTMKKYFSSTVLEVGIFPNYEK